MSVLPEQQNSGVGSALVKQGLAHCAEQGYAAMVVLGHPKFYLKFGFVASVNFAIKSEYGVFMVLELRKNSLRNQRGTVSYHEAFN